MRKRIKEVPTVSLYMHFPFCESKCPYCAFYSVRPGKGDMEEYFSSLSLEIDFLEKEMQGFPPVKTLYIGGGTPTIASSGIWKNMVSILENRFRFLQGAEVTVEANPGSMTREQVMIWKDWRVTRVSLGVQSLEDRYLKTLGRIHDSRQALQAMEKTSSAGLSLSVDMLFGLPGQKMEVWIRDLGEIISLGVDHVSTYQLSLEWGTPWGDFPPTNIPDGYPFYRWAQYYLEKHGFRQYEIASFARHGKWCRHNVAYWFGKDVIGLGPSAWGFIKGVRTGNIRDLRKYSSMLRAGIRPVSFREKLDLRGQVSEAAILALRTRWGIRFERFRKLYGERALEDLLSRLDELPSRIIRRNPWSAALTRDGMRVGNAVWERLLP